MLAKIGMHCRRPVVVGSVGIGALVAALVTSPAHALIAPPGAPPADATGTLALCVGEQQGATTYIYADGPTNIPSAFTQLIVPPQGLDCRAYPAAPGKYYISGYKYPKVPCPPDRTRPPGATTPPGLCYGTIHHIHESHVPGTITGTTFGGGFIVPTLGTGQTPECPTNFTTAPSGFTAPTPCGTGDGKDYGVEYSQPVNDVLGQPTDDDTVVEEKTTFVEVRANETTQVAMHIPDHETSECSPTFDPDVNGNAPVCN